MRYLLFSLLVINVFCFEVFSQDLYSARGYWEESTKPNYLSIKQRLTRGDSLNTNELAYLQDYETYLTSYFQKMPETEKQEFERMKEQWNKELIIAKTTPSQIPSQPNTNFEWRTRDRVVTAFYGTYYGTSLVVVAGIDGPAAAGIPLIAGGLSLLGPALNPKKYEGITRNTVRAGNTGKLLGLGYGAALGLALGGESDDTGKIVLALSSVGSITLGEIAFHLQKQKNISIGQIELMRHYGILGPLVGASLMATGNVHNPNLYGLALLGGGVSGLVIGNRASKKYNYSLGDVDAISSLTVIMAGVGFTAVAEAINNSSEPDGLLLIPTATAILGTALGQKVVRDVHLTSKQGSTIQLSAAGAALVGFGIAAMIESESPVVILGVPSVLALVTHQMLFHKFKMKNMEMNLKSSEIKKQDRKLSFKLTPENYLLNKKIPAQNHSPSVYSKMQNPLFSIRFTF